MAAHARAVLVGLVLAALVSVPAAASAAALGISARLASPAFPSEVSAAGGAIAWAAASGSGHRFQIVVREGARDRALRATSAMGWIDGVKLGTGASGRPIVVYSHCPHSPFAGARAGSAGTDGCRLWWARLSGGAAQLIAAAPADTSVGAAAKGVVAFAVQPNTAREHQPARIETARLSGGRAHALTVPSPDGATIDDIGSHGEQVVFAESPSSGASDTGLSEVWLDEGTAPPKLIAKVASDSNPIDDSEQFFDGVTVTSGFVYVFLYAEGGIVPPVPSQLEQIALPGLVTGVAAWAPGGALSGNGIQASAFDPSDDRLILSLFSPQSEFDLPSSSCSTRTNSAKACPVVESGAVAFVG
jgi:hypothetical protein